MKRKRFTRNRVCSSDNYKLSRVLYNEYIVEQHKTNIEMVEQITVVNYIKKAYVRCFGELIPITLEEAHRIENTVTIIYK